MTKICKSKQGFWFQMVLEWCKLNYHFPQNQETVLNQIIWWNSNIKVGTEMLHNKHSMRNGMMKISDIVTENENKRFLTHSEVVSKFGKCISWLEYQSIIQAIPKYWKWALTRDGLLDSHEPLYQEYRIAESTTSISSKVYSRLTNSEEGLIVSACKWNKLLNLDFDNETHRDAFKNIYRVTNVTKFRNFQFRLLHNKIFCNNVLYYWNLKESQKCDFCDFEKQDIIHLLYSCPTSYSVWQNLEHILKEIGESSMLIWNVSNIIYNLVHPKKGHIINTIVLLTKFYLYRCKCQMSKPSVFELYNEILLMQNIEQYNATKTNRIKKNELKWQPLNMAKFYYLTCRTTVL